MNFLNQNLQQLTPYTPGEQPKIGTFIKLNTNENPYPPAPGVVTAVAESVANLALYADPTCQKLTKALAKELSVPTEAVFLGNGSDEVLAFCFQGFMEKGCAFPAITYGFYQVFSQLYQVTTKVIPLSVDLTVNLRDYQGLTEVILLANPNAPTGLVVGKEALVELVEENPQRLVIIDEAYIDFGGGSLVSETQHYPNLLVVGTFSKSRQLAGGRLGYAVGSSNLIQTLNTLKFSVNPYNINAMTQAAGIAVLADETYYQLALKKVLQTREWTKQALKKLGFHVTDSQGNFVFISHQKIAGEVLYQELKARNILVRWFNQAPIEEYIRVTIGTQEQMEIFIEELTKILEECRQ